MELFIRIKDGAPFEHPILGDNFRQAFPEVDTENLPPWAARFNRIERPVIGVYEVYEGVTYEWVGSVVEDVHHVRLMAEAERTAKQEQVKAEWNNRFSSWTFNEDTCAFDPPTSMPTEGGPYQWDEATTSWIQLITA